MTDTVNEPCGDAGDEYGILVSSIVKNSRTQIKIHINEYMGTTFLDIREFYCDRESRTWKPSRKGIAVRDDLYPELLQGIIDAGPLLGLDHLDDPDDEDDDEGGGAGAVAM